MTSAFKDCDNLTVDATDAPDLRLVSSLNKMFSGAINFNTNISHWDVSSVTDMESMFEGAISFNQDLSLWDVSSVTTMEYMFRNAGDFNQDISNWDISSVRDMESMFSGATLSSENYDALLNSWSQQQVQIGINFHGGNSMPTENSADAKAILTSAPNNWRIIDGSTP
jgi:surface protein